MLDAELEKVETFYAEREKEMQERAKRLREQLNELGIHRQMFYVGALVLEGSTYRLTVIPSDHLPTPNHGNGQRRCNILSRLHFRRRSSFSKARARGRRSLIRLVGLVYWLLNLAVAVKSLFLCKCLPRLTYIRVSWVC